MIEFEIPVEGVPQGYYPIEYRVPINNSGEPLISHVGTLQFADAATAWAVPRLILAVRPIMPEWLTLAGFKFVFRRGTEWFADIVRPEYSFTLDCWSSPSPMAGDGVRLRKLNFTPPEIPEGTKSKDTLIELVPPTVDGFANYRIKFSLPVGYVPATFRPPRQASGEPYLGTNGDVLFADGRCPVYPRLILRKLYMPNKWLLDAGFKAIWGERRGDTVSWFGSTAIPTWSDAGYGMSLTEFKGQVHYLNEFTFTPPDIPAWTQPKDMLFILDRCSR